MFYLVVKNKVVIVVIYFFSDIKIYLEVVLICDFEIGINFLNIKKMIVDLFINGILKNSIEFGGKSNKMVTN